MQYNTPQEGTQTHIPIERTYMFNNISNISRQSHFESNILPHVTFYPKSQKPIKAVMRHLPVSAPAERISDGLVGFGCDVIA
jgi:hypothetical protein